MKFQRGWCLTFCLFVQASFPAGPDGIRERSSCLRIGLDALFDFA